MTAKPTDPLVLIELDRRQRLAAAVLLAAVDLPQQAAGLAALWIDAGRICPGVGIDEISPGDGRLALLVKARDLVQQMIDEETPA